MRIKYREFSARSQLLTNGTKSKPDQIAEWIGRRLAPFSKRDIVDTLPDISQITIKRTLATLLKNGDICKHGGGSATTYTRQS